MTSPKRYGLAVTEFCRANKISDGEFYRLLSAGRGPCIMRIGGRSGFFQKRWQNDGRDYLVKPT